MKRRVKKLLSAVLTMAMVLSLLPAQTLAEEESKEEFILLLVTDGALMMPTNVIGLDGTPVYASEGAYSVYLDADKCPESLKKNKEGRPIINLSVGRAQVKTAPPFQNSDQAQRA